MNINKDLFEELKQDIKLLMKVEGELNNNIQEQKTEQINLQVNCCKCKNPQNQEYYGKKEDGTYYKSCDSCLEKSRIVEKRRIRKPLSEEQKRQKYGLRKNKRILNKLNNPPEQIIKQTKQEKLEKKKIYYEENKQDIRTKYSNKMKLEEAKQKERDRKTNYYWQNHDKVMKKNREYYQKIKIKKDNFNLTG